MVRGRDKGYERGGLVVLLMLEKNNRKNVAMDLRKKVDALEVQLCQEEQPKALEVITH